MRNHRRKIFILSCIGFGLSLLVSCGGSGGGGSSRDNGTLQVTINRDKTEYQLFEGDHFPTFLGHLFGRQCLGQTETLDLAEITVDNQSDVPVQNLRVEIEVPWYSNPYTEILSLGPGEEKTIALTPVFIATALSEITEETTGYIKLTLTDFQGRRMDEWDKPIVFLSRNDMVWSISEGESEVDLSPFISVFVTPRNALVKEAFAAAKEYSSLNKSLIGYQECGGLTHLDIIFRQLEAIYNYLKDQGIGYTHTPVSFFQGAQSVKYPDETLTTKSGNCIDLTCLIVSMLEAMNMRPLIFITSTHAFAGVYLWADDDTVCAIETTMVGISTFADAWNEGRRKYIEEFEPGTDKIIDIKICREIGILPN